MAWVRVRDLGAISPASKGNLPPRDCAEIAHPHPSHLEALPSNGACRECHGDIGNGRVRSDSTKWPSTVVIGAWVHLALERFGARAQVAVKAPQTPMCQPPPYSATLSNRNKPGRFRYLRGILCALRPSVAPVGDQAASAQSRRNLATSGNTDCIS